MPHEARVHLVEDPDDGHELAEFVAGLSDRLHRRAVVHPTPGVRTRSQFAGDLLVALGKSFDALASERCTGRAWELAESWIAAERVGDLFLLRAHLLPPALRQAIVDLAQRVRCDVWFVGGRFLDSQASSTSQGAEPCFRWDRQRFVDHWAGIQAAEGPPTRLDRFPEVPGDDFLTFRASCRQLLDPASFERVDSVFCGALAETRAWLWRWRSRQLPLPTQEVAIDSVGLYLQGLLASSSSPPESLTRLRGAQAALFRAGWLVTFRPEAFGVSDMGSLLLRPGLGPGAATRLRRLCSPQSAAVMALFLVADLNSQAMSRLSLASVADDGGEVTVDSDRFSVPEYAEGLLRAQLIHRRREGGSAEDPLFQPTVADVRRATLLLDDLRSSGNRTAVSVGRSDLRGAGGGGAVWLRTRHVHVTRLAGLRRGASL